MEHLRITVDGKVYEVTVERVVDSPGRSSIPHPSSAAAPPAPHASPPAPSAKAPPASQPRQAAQGDAVSPLAGIVQAISAKVGSTVSAGDAVLTLEAMKMYTPINASVSGTLTAIHVSIGDAVEEGQLLYTIS